MENSRWDKFRVLTISLIFSGALNIGLLLALAFSALEESNETIGAAKLGSHEAPALTNRHFLADMLKLSFSELVVYLTNCDLLEDGYTKRDLALSALVASHDFNLEKALSTAPQKRLVALSQNENVEFYPGLTDEQYEAIIRYAYQEKWPLTSKGLFQMLAKWPKVASEGRTREESLCEAFFITSEFYALQVLFQKTGAPQDPYLLLDLITEGPWEILERFAKEQANALDLSIDKRRALLFTYLSLQCPTAAELLLRTDFLFAKTRLVDAGVLLLLDLLREKSSHAERFCIDLLRSPRTDAVWKAAADKLYTFAGEKAPESFDLTAVLSRFSNDSAPEFPAVPKVAAASSALTAPAETIPSRLREHIVQEGDNLWKISRQYKVKTEDLIRHNGLEKDRLFPGMVLSIPQGTGSEPPR